MQAKFYDLTDGPEPTRTTDLVFREPCEQARWEEMYRFYFEYLMRDWLMRRQSDSWSPFDPTPSDLAIQGADKYIEALRKRNWSV